MSLDDLDRKILDRVQSDFPLVSRPFQALAKELGCTEEEILRRIRRMEGEGTIRRIGPIFEIQRLGFTSTLCAAKVSPALIDSVAEYINHFPEVTHNYLRENEYNVWFTLVAPSEERIATILEEIRHRGGVAEVASLPAERTFKINAHLKV
jgi:DNA-binding Lrp family transcriptional regulator